MFKASVDAYNKFENSPNGSQTCPCKGKLVYLQPVCTALAPNDAIIQFDRAIKPAGFPQLQNFSYGTKLLPEETWLYVYNEQENCLLEYQVGPDGKLIKVDLVGNSQPMTCCDPKQGLPFLVQPADAKIFTLFTYHQLAPEFLIRLAAKQPTFRQKVMTPASIADFVANPKTQPFDSTAQHHSLLYQDCLKRNNATEEHSRWSRYQFKPFSWQIISAELNKKDKTNGVLIVEDILGCAQEVAQYARLKTEMLGNFISENAYPKQMADITNIVLQREKGRLETKYADAKDSSSYWGGVTDKDYKENLINDKWRDYTEEVQFDAMQAYSKDYDINLAELKAEADKLSVDLTKILDTKKLYRALLLYKIDQKDQFSELETNISLLLAGIENTKAGTLFTEKIFEKPDQSLGAMVFTVFGYGEKFAGALKDVDGIESNSQLETLFAALVQNNHLPATDTTDDLMLTLATRLAIVMKNAPDVWLALEPKISLRYDYCLEQKPLGWSVIENTVMEHHRSMVNLALGKRMTVIDTVNFRKQQYSMGFATSTSKSTTSNRTIALYDLAKPNTPKALPAPTSTAGVIEAIDNKAMQWFLSEVAQPFNRSKIVQAVATHKEVISQYQGKLLGFLAVYQVFNLYSVSKSSFGGKNVTTKDFMAFSNALLGTANSALALIKYQINKRLKLTDLEFEKYAANKVGLRTNKIAQGLSNRITAVVIVDTKIANSGVAALTEASKVVTRYGIRWLPVLGNLTAVIMSAYTIHDDHKEFDNTWAKATAWTEGIANTAALGIAIAAAIFPIAAPVLAPLALACAVVGIAAGIIHEIVQNNHIENLLIKSFWGNSPSMPYWNDQTRPELTAQLEQAKQISASKSEKLQQQLLTELADFCHLLFKPQFSVIAQHDAGQYWRWQNHDLLANVTGVPSQVKVNVSLPNLKYEHETTTLQASFPLFQLGSSQIAYQIYGIHNHLTDATQKQLIFGHQGDQRIHKKMVFRRENKGINNHTLIETLHFNNTPGYDDFVGVIAYQSPAGFPVVLYYEFELTRGLIYGRNFEKKTSTKQKAEQI